MPYRVMIIGLGQIGLGYDLLLDASERVYSHARAFSQHPAFELVCGVDADPAKRENLTRFYGCQAFADLRDALTECPVDVLVLAVPTPAHGPLLRQILDIAPPRLILCEKPLSEDVEETRAMVALCEEKQVSLFANFIRRSDQAAIEVGARIADGRIAGPLSGVCWYSKGLKHNGSHFINLLTSWLGPVQHTQLIAAGRPWGEQDAEPEFALDFRAGRIVFLPAREEAFSHYTIELVASNGRLRYEHGGRHVYWQAAVPGEIAGYTVLSTEETCLENGMARYQWHVAEQVARQLVGKPAALCSGAEALLTDDVIQRIMTLRDSTALAPSVDDRRSGKND